MTAPQKPPVEIAGPHAAGMTLAAGTLVLVNGQPGTIVAVLPLNEVLVRDKTTGHTFKVKVDLQPPAPTDKPAPRPPADLHALSETHWTVAVRRYQAIEGLRTRDAGVPAVLEQARAAGVHFTTLYRWHRHYQAEDGRIAALAPNGSQGGRGQSRLDPRVQGVIQEVLQDSYLTKQRLKVSAIRRLIEARCRQEGLTVPAYNTVLARILQLPSYDRIKARIGAKEAREAAAIHRGPYEGAEFPFAIVQVDHTPLDIILVDEATRLPIGRPWLTLAIDVYSRMVLGYYLSFDPPGAISVGLCLVHAILPKDAWQVKFGLKAEWPCWGLPVTIHADNGKDFHCESLQRACLEHQIHIEWRPLGRANFGGHIERLLGTFLQEMHQLAGTTFSNVTERGNYESMKNSAFTLREFECWLANLITGNYHQRPHGGLQGQCPLKRFEEGILGNATQPGRGRPPRLRSESERRLLLDFLPGVERRIQEYGVQIDRIIYFSDDLRPHVQAVDPEHPTETRRYVFRRDPRDISVVYFLNPNTQEYCPVPYRNTAFPPISVWELREAHRRIRAHHRGQINEDMIFETIRKMHEVEETAVAVTTKARRTIARQRTHRETSLHKSLFIEGAPRKEQESKGPPNPGMTWPEEVQPFAVEGLEDQAKLFSKPIKPFAVES